MGHHPARRCEGRLVVATHNAGKLREIGELLAPFKIEPVSAADLGLAEPAETGTTFAENARIKAQAAAVAANLPALADDSGLAVWALHGAPGVFSARWAGAGKDFMPAMARIEAELAARNALTPQARIARFVAALCLAWPDGEVVAVEGAIDGAIVWPPRGELGFGYDPIFLPDGETRTFGEMSAEEKHGVDWTAGRGLSHRARAFLKLAEASFVRE
ncbi:RdgB/HAM1 family non-canonical purine NTP pyrophosphatase [Blastochloris viridis]|uniref:dITP/XTP pyrophosphatase n=1 Tax=Blastochloris viridis TaxID=1079 RepID=A0A0H5BE09_BLAVI|nr:RdgB/HAM1 family non-canonical purine NTP pyrophosphatase [Blastochloris viridis]ALK10707.1 Non-canonical purine NTP pyrophosphatase [Blastochloris viridis]BAR99329.1 nucleoside 5-triphosphatase RdgB [Blastochloris viridis]CUU43369.1 Non-canonical purine NTP pyrophosphatase [Blastochloris viridis]